jgi:hypothetical protein
VALAPGSLAAQSPAAQRVAAPTDVPVAPIECWWKTDRGAVRVGEHFTLTLTCAVLDTERARVVVDESGLAPSALHLVPFDIVDGQRFQDIQNAPRRFFQYQYTMRVLGEEFFGKEVMLPRLQVSYRVQNSLQGGSALSGRETQYSLMPVPIRVFSLVPPGASEIRDTPTDTFGDVERRLFRSNVLMMLSGVAFVLGALMAGLLLVRAAAKRRSAVAARPRVVSHGAALRAASNELGAVRAASQSDGWSSDLTGRAASALRLAGAVALSRPIRQLESDGDAKPREGQVLAARGLRDLRGGKKIWLSAAVTPAATGTNGASAAEPPAWGSIRQTLGAFSEAHYSRDGALDGTALDTALAEGQDAIRRLRLSQWRRFGRRKGHAHSEAARPTWAR